MGKKLKAAFISSLLCLAIFVAIDLSFDIIENVTGDIFYVNTTGAGGAFISIQDAINASKDGDKVFVYSGAYYENLVVNKTINLTGEDKETTIINGDGTGHVVQITSNWVNMTSFTVTGSGNDHAGIKLISVRNSRVEDSNLTNTRYGISLDSSYECSIENNDCSNSSLNLHSSFNNRILNNTCFKSWLETSSNNNLLKENEITRYFSIRHASINNKLYSNKMKNCGLFIYGSIETFATQEIPPNNTVNNKPLYYYKNVNMNNASVPLDAGQVILGNVSWAKVENLNVSYGTVGIELGYSSNNYIANNTCSFNYYGIYLMQNCDNNIIKNNSILSSGEIGLYIGISNGNIINGNNISSTDGAGLYFAISHNNIIKNNFCSNNTNIGFHFQFCDDNVIEGNIISNNSFAMYLLTSLGNKVYHNNFINNTNQAHDSTKDENQWDDGYPSGGNYWSVYSGVDNFKGPNQDQPGSDGIGDTNYSIDTDTIDNYPLMDPYINRPLENYSVLKQGWNLISIPLIQTDQNLTKVLEMINGYYDAVQWYDIKDPNNPWKHHKVGKPFGNDLYQINQTMGFWIYITQPGDTIFIYNGTQPTSNQTITLHPGWNLVGYPSLTSYNRTQGLNNLTFDTHINAIWTYNAATQKWKEIGQSDYFEIGKGYWIHAKTSCEWEVPL